MPARPAPTATLAPHPVNPTDPARLALKGYVWTWLVAAAALALVAAGLLNLRSIGAGAGAGAGAGHLAALWTNQLIWSLLGLGLGAGAALLGPRRLDRWALLPVGLALAAALAVALGFGASARGASRWITLFGLPLHVGTLLQVGLIAALAWCSARVRRHEGGRRWLIGLVLPLGLVLLTLLLLARQPDMLAAVVVLGLAIVMLAVEFRTLVAAVILAALGAVGPVLLWQVAFHAYQRQRIAAFLSPGADPHGAGYFTTTSVERIAAGRLGGQGWMSWGESSATGGLLPEAHTDGALTVWAYEWGHLGVAVLLGLLLLLGLGLLAIARRASRGGDRFGAVFAVGTAAWILAQAALHTCAVTGLIPYVSASLPLVSYGGTGAALTLACLGLCVGAGLRTAAPLDR